MSLLGWLLIHAVSVHAQIIDGQAMEIAEEVALADVELSSDPEGATVYFIPVDEFDSDSLNSSRYMADYLIHEGLTNTSTRMRELRYHVVFELDRQREVREGFKVINGQQNSIHVSFEVDPRVRLWSDPAGARVFLIPRSEYHVSMLGDPGELERFEWSDRTNTTVELAQGTEYVIVFQGDRAQMILEGYVPAEGKFTAVGARFPDEDE